MLSNYSNCMCLLKIKNKLKIGCFYKKLGRILDILWASYKTIIILFHRHVGYEMIIANSVLLTSLAVYHLISNAQSWNNC